MVEDIVPRRQVDRHTLLKLNAAAGQVVVVVTPGELVENIDGEPWGAGPSQAAHYLMTRPTVHLSALEAAGLTPADVPNLRVIPL